MVLAVALHHSHTISLRNDDAKVWDKIRHFPDTSRAVVDKIWSRKKRLENAHTNARLSNEKDYNSVQVTEQFEAEEKIKEDQIKLVSEGYESDLEDLNEEEERNRFSNFMKKIVLEDEVEIRRLKNLIGVVEW